MSVTQVSFVVACDHGISISRDCRHCEVAFNIARSRPLVSIGSFNRVVLGNCDECGDEIMLDGHLWRRTDGTHVCDRCVGQNRGCS